MATENNSCKIIGTNYHFWNVGTGVKTIFLIFIITYSIRTISLNDYEQRRYFKNFTPEYNNYIMITYNNLPRYNTQKYLSDLSYVLFSVVCLLFL